MKKINNKYASKLLSILDYNKNNNSNDMKFYDRDLEKLNKKYILYEVINLFF